MLDETGEKNAAQEPATTMALFCLEEKTENCSAEDTNSSEVMFSLPSVLGP